MDNFFFKSPVSDVSRSTSENTHISEGSGFFHDCDHVEEFHRDFYKGKSFRLSNAPWSRSKTYINDDFYQDLVVYNDSLYACLITNTGLYPDQSKFWMVVAGRGAQGPQGIQGVKGDKGDKGDSGNGNFEVGQVPPTKAAYENDIYLNLVTGDIYRHVSREWIHLGKIFVDTDLKIEWEDYGW